jgi:hypothetical protein
MSSEFARAILRHYQPAILAQRHRQLVEPEWIKGSTPWLGPVPVQLEPVYQPLARQDSRLETASLVSWVPAPEIEPGEWQRLQVWISPEQEGDWRHHSERFLKQLSRMRHPFGLELLGNQSRVDQLLLFHRQDAPLLHAAFAGEFERCRLTSAHWVPHAWRPGRGATIHRLCDFFPAPPYIRLFTRPEELRGSLYGPIVSALATLPAEAFGLLQVLAQPVSPQHDWHDNVRRLIDIEYELKQVVAWNTGHLSAHHPPTGYISDMADASNTRAHNDKPFFFAGLRVAVGGILEDPDAHCDAMTCFVGMLQQGGRPLEHLSEQDYRRVLPELDFTHLLATGQVYRPGFLLNSEELTTLVHFCPPVATEYRPKPLEPLETLPPSDELRTGIQLGICPTAGQPLPVCIPPDARSKHLHIIGRPGCGKSSLLEHMILQEIELGQGVAVLDPHGTLADRLLDLIPPEQSERVIYFRPADGAYVPIWNPLHCSPGADPMRVAANLVQAVHSIVQGWGERLAHLLRHAFYAVLHLPGGSLREVADLLNKGSPESSALIRKLTAGLIVNPYARRFWTGRFLKYGEQELGPPQHKLSTLLMGGHGVSLMLSQPDSRFNLRQIMDEGRILLVDLSGLGAEVRDTLGSFMLALLHLTTLERLDETKSSPRPFHVYCDEAHYFVTESLKDIIAETRKFGVSLTLAHQFMSQFAASHTSALSSAGSAVVFGVNETDAEHLRKDFMGRVTTRDLIGQGVGRAIARIGTKRGTEVVRIQTPEPLKPRPDSCRNAIIAYSHEHYYEPIEVVQHRVNEQRDSPGRPSQFTDPGANDGEEFDFEEL